MSTSFSSDANRFGPQSAGVWTFAQQVSHLTDEALEDFVAAYKKQDFDCTEAVSKKLRPPAAILTAIERLFRAINIEKDLVKRVRAIDRMKGATIISSAELAARAITLRHDREITDDEFETLTGVYRQIGFDCDAMSNMGQVPPGDEPTIS